MVRSYSVHELTQQMRTQSKLDLEQLEPMRALEVGMTVVVGEIDDGTAATRGIDTPEDVRRLEHWWREQEEEAARQRRDDKGARAWTVR